MSGFTITGGEGEGGVLAGGGARITRNLITNNQSPNGAGIDAIGCGMEISENVIKENEAVVYGGGLLITGSSGCGDGLDPVIRNNLIMGNTAFEGAGLYLWEFAPWRNRWPVITQNTIVGNAGGSAVYFDIEYIDEWPSTPPTGRVTNNVIVGNSGRGLFVGATTYSYGPPISANIFFGNGDPQLLSPITAIGSDGNVVVDPMFRDPAAGDYRLQPGSPAIDAGADLPDPPVVDLDGFPRPLDGDLDGVALSDLGAFEETGEVAALTLAATGGSVSWSPRSGATFYNLYRGSLAVLLAGGDYTQDPAGAATRQWCDLADPSAIEDQDPPAGEAYFYLATPGGPAEGSLGFDSNRVQRPNANPCP